MIDELLDQVRSAHSRSGLSIAAFAASAGIGPTRLHGMHTEAWNPTAATLRAHIAISDEPTRKTRRESLPCATEWMFEGVMQRYLADEAYRHKRSARQEELLLQRHVLPHWRERHTASIAAADVLRIIDGLMDSGTPSSANRLLSLLSQLFLYAIRRGVVRSNPCAGIRRPHAPQPLQRLLSSDELRWVWTGLADHVPSVCHDALRFQLVTAQRLSEVAGADCNEFDLEDASWQLPPNRSKNGKAHMIPLSGLALNIATRRISESSASGPLLPSRRTTEALGYKSIAAAVSASSTKSGIRFSSRDLRRTAATGMVRLGVSRTVVAKVLNHADSRAIGAYDWHAYDAEKRDALERWADYLSRII